MGLTSPLLVCVKPLLPFMKFFMKHYQSQDGFLLVNEIY